MLSAGGRPDQPNGLNHNLQFYQLNFLSPNKYAIQKTDSLLI